MKKRMAALFIALAMTLTVTSITTDDVFASGGRYWLRVNRTANVVNVYKNVQGDWQPYRVMICSCGKNKSGNRTPKGNFSIKKKWRWQKLFHGVSGQYVSQFKGNYLFHSVVYKRKGKNSTCVRKEYNKLGKNASHGCVRLATMDAKWIYENCSRGTRVTVYSSKNPGPLGKPKRVAMKGKSSKFWDPTDPVSSNRNFNMTGPVISINKMQSVEYGTKFNVFEGVAAKSPYSFENLSASVAVHSITYCAPGENVFTSAPDKKVDTTVPGTYKITYKCYNKYCGKNKVYKTFAVTVNPEPEPEAESVPEVDDSSENSEIEAEKCLNY